MTLRSVLPLALLTLLLAGCLPPELREAKSAYEKGHFAEAKAHLDQLAEGGRGGDKTGIKSSMSDGTRATYELYRGLVELSLGDRDRGLSLLRAARTRRKDLSSDDRTLLDKAFEEAGTDAAGY